jgi:hypothetical protein
MHSNCASWKHRSLGSCFGWLLMSTSKGNSPHQHHYCYLQHASFRSFPPPMVRPLPIPSLQTEALHLRTKELSRLEWFYVQTYARDACNVSLSPSSALISSSLVTKLSNFYNMSIGLTHKIIHFFAISMGSEIISGIFG